MTRAPLCLALAACFLFGQCRCRELVNSLHSNSGNCAIPNGEIAKSLETGLGRGRGRTRMCPGSGLPHWADRGAALRGLAQTHTATGSHQPQPEQLVCGLVSGDIKVTWGQLRGRDQGRTEQTVGENRDRAVARAGLGDGAWSLQLHSPGRSRPKPGVNGVRKRTREKCCSGQVSSSSRETWG